MSSKKTIDPMIIVILLIGFSLVVCWQIGKIIDNNNTNKLFNQCNSSGGTWKKACGEGGCSYGCNCPNISYTLNKSNQCIIPTQAQREKCLTMGGQIFMSVECLVDKKYINLEEL